MSNSGYFAMKKDLESMCRNAVDRSQGGLLEIDIWDYGTDDLLNYIADRSSNLRSLKLPNCFLVTDEGVAKAVVKLPLLEELDISFCGFTGDSVRVVGQSCPKMKMFLATEFLHCESNCESNDIAIAIGETMPELRYLELGWNRLNNTGLNAILDGCPHLEHLDLSFCFNLTHVSLMEMRLPERIRVLRLPDVSAADLVMILNWCSNSTPLL
ncbi:putative F-box/LRR-repeat protein 23 [Capsella rubella]|uniref:putative F-box/LRR-repeat protein 23 n=1 Tax=Capsella rubella TaxID=81985 RepID=UPI000CD5A14F|nr:putative F-box/LRR-repeat protein 23 [Capsella rubella]